MKFLTTLFLICILASAAQAGGRFTLDPINRVAHLQFKVVLYSDITTPEMARVIQDYTNRAWDGQGLLPDDQPLPQSLTYLGTRYVIQPHIEVVSMNSARGEAAALANTDRTVNYFYVNYGRNGGGTVSYVPDLGTSCGYLEVNMQLDTLAHEMGHNLRMSHRDWINARPPLMYPKTNPACLLQEEDVNQIQLPAPEPDGTFVIGRLCDSSETLLGETEDGTSWDYDYLTWPTVERLEIFPNPVRQGQPIRAWFPSTVDAQGEATFYDMHGRFLNRQTVKIRNGNNQIMLNTSSLHSAGTYVIRVTFPGMDDSRIFTGKLIVL